MREKKPEKNIFGHFSSSNPLKKFSDKILLENNMTYLLKNRISKNVYNERRITLSKASSSSFSDSPCSSSFTFFDAICQFWETNLRSFKKCITYTGYF